MYYFATFIFILLAAKGTFVPFFNINWFLIDFIFIWIGLSKNRFDKRDLRFGGYFILIYILYCTLRSTFITNLPLRYYVSDNIFLFKYILPCMIYCALMKEMAVEYLTRVIIDLTKISLVFFCIQLVAGDLLYNIGAAINLPPHISEYHYTNFLVFTYVKEHAYQNSGFSWEPGAYGFFLIIALIMQLFKNGFKLDTGAKWLIVGVLTTLSTTSYAALGVVFLMYFRANGVKYSTLLLIAGPLLIAAAVKLPFLLDKVITIYKHDLHDLQNIEYLSAWYIRHGEQMPFNRFASLIYIYQQFKWQLIFGVSNIFIETVPYLANANTSSGIFEYFAKFGVVAFVFFMTRLCMFFYRLNPKKELLLYCVLLVLILGFSESIFILPMMTIFYFLYFYAGPPDDECQHEDNSAADDQYKLTDTEIKPAAYR